MLPFSKVDMMGPSCFPIPPVSSRSTLYLPCLPQDPLNTVPDHKRNSFISYTGRDQAGRQMSLLYQGGDDLRKRGPRATMQVPTCARMVRSVSTSKRALLCPLPKRASSSRILTHKRSGDRKVTAVTFEHYTELSRERPCHLLPCFEAFISFAFMTCAELFLSCPNAGCRRVAPARL